MSIDYDLDDAVATVTINRPDKLNALNESMKARLTLIFREVNDDPGVRAVVLTGAGRNFSAGGDVGTMTEVTAASSKARLGTAHALVRAIAGTDKPVIAAVRGPVAGMSCGLAWACDLVIASETTVFHHSFKRIGLAPDGGTVFFLRQTLGPALAKELILTGRPMSAREAKDLRLVNQVVPDTELATVAREQAVELAAGPSFAYGLSKSMFRAVDTPSLETFLQLEAGLQGMATLSEDHKEGASAFRQKRSPQFTGR